MACLAETLPFSQAVLYMQVPSDEVSTGDSLVQMY